ncbi:Sialyltransferase-like protein [Drosera capensis]
MEEIFFVPLVAHLDCTVRVPSASVLAVSLLHRRLYSSQTIHFVTDRLHNRFSMRLRYGPNGEKLGPRPVVVSHVQLNRKHTLHNLNNILCREILKTRHREALSYEFNICDAMATCEHVRNGSTVLSSEFMDALPNGWEERSRVVKGTKQRALYSTQVMLIKGDVNAIERSSLIEIWHKRLDHISEKNLQILTRKQFLPEVKEWKDKLEGSSSVSERTMVVMGSSSKKLIRSRDVIFFEDQSIEDIKKPTNPIAPKDKVFLRVSRRSYSSSRSGLLPDDGLIRINPFMGRDLNHVAIAHSLPPEQRLRAGATDPLASCSMIKTPQVKEPQGTLRWTATEHQRDIGGVTLYPSEQSLGQGSLSIVANSVKSRVKISPN